MEDNNVSYSKKTTQKTVDEIQVLVCGQLAALLDEKKTSYYKLAQLTGMSISTLYNLKKAKFIPSLTTILIILTILDEPISSFFHKCFLNTSMDATELTKRLKRHTSKENIHTNNYVLDTNPEKLFVTVSDSAGNLINISLKSFIESYIPPKNP